jgi:hypothetical protein
MHGLIITESITFEVSASSVPSDSGAVAIGPGDPFPFRESR